MLALIACLGAPTALAKGNDGADGATTRYIVELVDPPVAAYDGRELPDLHGSGFTRMRATSTDFTGAARLNAGSAESLEYLDFLSGRQEDF
ncbi:MAG: hypothetical protein KJN94_10110, partial [Gammaproteobacteria bacterium]|nr:hypothetical protein [Gammaproteobacteria bacterium]